jgi:hypothetical protein
LGKKFNQRKRGFTGEISNSAGVQIPTRFNSASILVSYRLFATKLILMGLLGLWTRKFRGER